MKSVTAPAAASGAPRPPGRVPGGRLAGHPPAGPGQAGAGPPEAEGLVAGLRRSPPNARPGALHHAAPPGERERRVSPVSRVVVREEERDPGDAEEHGGVVVHRAVVGHASSG